MAITSNYARQLANESLEQLKKRYKRIYNQAAREMREKQEAFMRKYSNERSERLKALDNTPEAKREYEQWLKGQAARQAWIDDMADSLAERATEANIMAVAALDNVVPYVYSESANHAAYSIEKAARANISFNLVDEQTVRQLVKRGAPIVREVTFPKVDRPKDYRWNRQRFKSSITQGIIQGESIPDIVKRTNGIFGSNAAAAFRAARTATTSAENAGRLSSYEKAEEMGIKVKKEWMATLDDNTRETHRQLDGEQVDVDGYFETENGRLRDPADPLGPAEEVYNCRCTLVAAIEGKEYGGWKEDKEIAGLSYSDWKEARG